MKIGILTLTLHTNYGGLLQTYALQQVLESQGHQCSTITDTRLHHLSLKKAPLAYAKRIINRFLFGRKEIRIFEEQHYNQPYRHTQRFIDKHINVTLCKNPSVLPERKFDAIIVGSDQIWRPLYYPQIENAYLAFASTWDIKRIAYAPSFGTDRWEYTTEQTKTCSKLLSMFDAVSVREQSGSIMCKEHFGIDANHVLDPTMLLMREDYEKLANDTRPSEGNLMVYMLDENENAQQIVELLKQKRQFIPFRTNSNVENPKAKHEEKLQPPLEQWIRGFMDAKCVITDSFHACVFSILFNKPFLVIGNKERGLDRFKSLLSLFNLQHQMIHDTSDIDDSLFEIDWKSVNKLLDEKRNESLSFLTKAITR